MSGLADKVVEILRQHAQEQGTIVRSTSDLSPLEEWLILKVVDENENKD
jgi:hypothetical protein